MEIALPPPTRLYSMTRRFSMVAVATAIFVAVVIVLVISRDIVWLSTIGEDSAGLAQAQMSVSSEIAFIMAVLLVLVINLIISYSRNLKLLFKNETGVLEKVSNGDLSRMVPVATRDEFGVIAGHTNSMIEALRHRIQLLSALKLAEEVQRNLLPSGAPRVPGLDISGTSIYCDETGGDYYDYIELPNGRLGVVVADASGHGIDAALHMTTARAFLVFAARNFTGPALMLDEVNRYLTRDSVSTSRFMSMFFLEIDPQKRSLRWVRAGHEPAMVYLPEADDFSELAGDGMAMGVTTDYTFKEYTAGELKPGSVVVITTDGISETRNPEGEMFGVDRLRETIRNQSGNEAEQIKAAVIESVDAFRGSAAQEDDITLVVIKVL
jgi:sigma-B regulation protein RsbU (phosphoserine phosphatase)